MKVTKATIEQLNSVLLENLETDIIKGIAARLDVSVESALRIYYSNPLAAAIEANDFGMQYLDASYLVEGILKNSNERR